jgi:hypothetical protein
MAQDDNYTNVILEEVREQYKIIQEGLDNLKDVPVRLPLDGVISSAKI